MKDKELKGYKYNQVFNKITLRLGQGIFSGFS